MAKSSFWDDLGNALTRKAKGLSSKAENLYEIQKIRNKLSAQERMTEKLMMDTQDLASDVGSVLYGEEAVACGLIQRIGSLSDALDALYVLIDEKKK